MASILLAACSAAPQEVATTTVRDSAGISIVEMSAPTWQGMDAAWRVAEVPHLEIGQALGDPVYELHSVRGAAILADGSVALALAGTWPVQVYDSTGRFVSGVGQFGAGPGEVSIAHSVWESADGRLHIHDAVDGRIATFDPDGRHIRTVRVPHGSVFTGGGLLGLLDDGSILHRLVSTAIHHTEGLRREPEYFVRYDPDRQRTDTLFTLSGRETYQASLDGMAMRMAPVFGRASHATLLDGRIVHGDDDRFELVVSREDGTFEAIYRVLAPQTEAADGEIRAEREARRAVARQEHREPRQRRLLEHLADRVPAHATLPAFGRLRADGDGHLWVERSLRPGDDRQSFHVFDPTGVWLGDVQVPDGLTVLAIGSGALVGMARDEWDAPVARVFRIHKPEDP